MKKTITITLGFLIAASVNAAVMNSSSYSIQSDSVNFGGGLSESPSYKQESTLGEIATGQSSSSSYVLKAGYQQLQEVYLAISSVSNVALTPSIPFSGGGVADGSTSVTVTTDNPVGYELYIKASSSPALASGLDSFNDYVTAGADPDFTFTVASNSSGFGFSPEGADIVQKYKDNGSGCNIGSSDTSDACWDKLTTSDVLISLGSLSNYPSGAATTLKFRAESGATNILTSGTYTATSTLTAVAP